MNDAQLAIYQSLSRALGGKAIDPRYAPKHKQPGLEAALKQWARENWRHKGLFPIWVHDWIAKWKAEAAEEAGGDVGADGGGATEEGDVRVGGVSGQGRGDWTDIAERMRVGGADDVERVDDDASQGRWEAEGEVGESREEV